MFRKPKRAANKDALRRKADGSGGDESTRPATDKADGSGSDTDSGSERDTAARIAQAHKRLKPSRAGDSTGAASATSSSASGGGVLHTFASSTGPRIDERDLATSTAAHHPTSAAASGPIDSKSQPEAAGFGADGVFRDKTRNKFHAGPLRAAAHVRATARFDYQPDVCKDYKQTGFCGFGDTCIYLHDRSDTLSGWQLEQQWQQQQQAKKQAQDAELEAYLKRQERGGTRDSDAAAAAKAFPDDGLPFACHLCRRHFTEPVVTNCLHYFCQKCILAHVREVGDACPICGKDTFGVFNAPSKLLAKKRKVLGASRANEEDSWKLFYDFFHGGDETEA